MQTVYLKDGRMADLVTKTEKGYLVDPYCVFKYYEDNEESAPSGAVELVQEIFEQPPRDLIEAECQKVYDRMATIQEEKDKIQKEVSTLRSEVASLSNKKTDLNRYIINREELRTAKRLILWADHEIIPRIMDGGSSHKFSVSYEINQYKEEERCWCYKLYSENRDSGWSGSTYFDSEYGIKIDLTDEQILELTHQRLCRKKEVYFSDHTILHTDDKWLTPKFINKKKEIKNHNATVELKKAEKAFKDAKEKIDELKNELMVS